MFCRNLRYTKLRVRQPKYCCRKSYLVHLNIGKTVWLLPPQKPQPRAFGPRNRILRMPLLILARLMGKSIVCPTLMHSYLFRNQFAFRPIGCTTAALVYLLHRLTELLQSHDYVLEFSKAIDSVRHHSLVSKLANFTLPDSFHCWMVNNLLSGRQHQTKLNGSVGGLA